MMVLFMLHVVDVMVMEIFIIQHDDGTYTRYNHLSELKLRGVQVNLLPE